METSLAPTLSEILSNVRQRRDEIETARSLPRDLAESLRSTGVFALSVPRAIGGAEAHALEIMRTIEAAAAADGSTGWCVMVGVANNVAAGYMPEEGARAVYADPTAPVAGIAAPGGRAIPVDGGVRVSGRWSFASGITHSDWVWAGALVLENGQPRMTEMGPDILHVYIPSKDIQIHDTWHVSGLCGTGSHDFSVEDVFIPEERTFRLLDPRGHRPEPLYQMPPLHLFVFQLVCVSLGIARAALDELTELAQTKVPTFYMSPLADRPVVQVELARAEAALRSARSFLYETVEMMWDATIEGRPISPQELALGRVACNHVVDTATRVTHTANTLAGGSAIYSTFPMQRHTRDAEAITHHFTVAPHVWEEAGRVLLGRSPVAPVF